MSTMKNAYAALTVEQDTVIRNMRSRTKNQPCTCVNCTFGREMLWSEQSLAGDLASQMFGHLVSTEVARLILTTFVADGVVQVFEGTFIRGSQSSEFPLHPHSEDVRRALDKAFKMATAHDCIRSQPGGCVASQLSQSADQEEEENLKTCLFRFRWRTFPREPVRSDELVSFFNEIIDRAFAAAEPHLPTHKFKLRHRFANPRKNYRIVRLTYDPDQESIPPPGFYLLPIQAFSGEGFDIVDKRYLNFSAARLVGDSNEDLVEGMEHMQRYAQGLKYAQPWVYHVLGMTYSASDDLLVFSRVDPSDWEHLTLMLWDGRGCIELIRILLGLAIADSVDLGQNPAIQLICEERTFQVDQPSDAAPLTADFSLDAADSDDSMSCSSSCHSSSSSLSSNTAEKGDHSDIEIEDDNDDNDEDP